MAYTPYIMATYVCIYIGLCDGFYDACISGRYTKRMLYLRFSPETATQRSFRGINMRRVILDDISGFKTREMN